MSCLFGFCGFGGSCGGLVGMDGSKTWSLVGMDGWVVDMELGWLVLVASMRMSMLACVFFHENDTNNISRRTGPRFASSSHCNRF